MARRFVKMIRTKHSMPPADFERFNKSIGRGRFYINNCVWKCVQCGKIYGQRWAAQKCAESHVEILEEVFG